VGNFTALGLKLAVEMLVSLFVGMTVREVVRARTAARLGDPTPRLWGRMSWLPKPWFDPFGSGLVPVLVAILWSVQVTMVPAAYGKPAPVDTTYFRRQPRDVWLVSLAGPLANLVLAIVAGLAARAVGTVDVDAAGLVVPTELTRLLVVFAFTNSALMIFHLLPIPGLDGARIVAILLPPNIRESYRNFDRYLPLLVLVILFLLGGLTLGILDTLAGAVCTQAVGVSCRGLMALG
jgi:Zn-dependent protease